MDKDIAESMYGLTPLMETVEKIGLATGNLDYEDIDKPVSEIKEELRQELEEEA